MDSISVLAMNPMVVVVLLAVVVGVSLLVATLMVTQTGRSRSKRRVRTTGRTIENDRSPSPTPAQGASKDRILFPLASRCPATDSEVLFPQEDVDRARIGAGLNIGRSCQCGLVGVLRPSLRVEWGY